MPNPDTLEKKLEAFLNTAIEPPNDIFARESKSLESDGIFKYRHVFKDIERYLLIFKAVNDLKIALNEYYEALSGDELIIDKKDSLDERVFLYEKFQKINLILQKIAGAESLTQGERLNLEQLPNHLIEVSNIFDTQLAKDSNLPAHFQEPSPGSEALQLSFKIPFSSEYGNFMGQCMNILAAKMRQHFNERRPG